MPSIGAYGVPVEQSGDCGFDNVNARGLCKLVSHEAQRSLQSRSLQIVDNFMQARWLFIAQSTARISIPMLVLRDLAPDDCLLQGLYAPRNATVAVALLCSVSLSCAVFLIVEM